jgi:hypothetical protein
MPNRLAQEAQEEKTLLNLTGPQNITGPMKSPEQDHFPLLKFPNNFLGHFDPNVLKKLERQEN